MARHSKWAIVLPVLGLIGLAAAAVLTPYSMLRDASGTFRDALRDSGYPAVDITKTRVDSGSGRSSKGYDVRLKVNDGCLLHLRMGQPGLIGHGYSLVEVNGEPLQLDGSPTYAEALSYAASHGYRKCKT